MEQEHTIISPNYIIQGKYPTSSFTQCQNMRRLYGAWWHIDRSRLEITPTPPPGKLYVKTVVVKVKKIPPPLYGTSQNPPPFSCFCWWSDSTRRKNSSQTTYTMASNKVGISFLTGPKLCQKRHKCGHPLVWSTLNLGIIHAISHGDQNLTSIWRYIRHHITSNFRRSNLPRTLMEKFNLFLLKCYVNSRIEYVSHFQWLRTCDLTLKF